MSPARVAKVMRQLGFERHGRHFVLEGADYYVEFPTGPLMVGDERVERTTERETTSGVLRLLTPTDCVKDRLAAYLHWQDLDALAQACHVAAEAGGVDLAEVSRWVGREGGKAKLPKIRKALQEATRT